MRCRILLFAQLAERVGAAQLAVELPDGATAGDALQQLVDQHEPIASMQGSLALAVDEDYASFDTPLHDGATLALIPPVSGG